MAQQLPPIWHAYNLSGDLFAVQWYELSSFIPFFVICTLLYFPFSHSFLFLFFQTAEIHQEIDLKQRRINVKLDEQNDILREFQQATTDKKFSDFLRKIFKKKYKPPKIRDPDGKILA